MTVEEKKQAIKDYCDKNPCKENTCPLYETDFSTGGVCIERRDSEEDINEMYRILFEQKNDPVNRPSHYTDGKIEVIDFIEDKKLGFCLGNAIKYIARAGKKDPTKEIEDLKKAKWYVERRIKELEECS